MHEEQGKSGLAKLGKWADKVKEKLETKENFSWEMKTTLKKSTGANKTNKEERRQWGW